MKKELIKSIRKELDERKMKSVQMLLRTVDGNLCIKFVSVESVRMKNKVKEVAERYCERMYLIRETPTTLVYGI